MRGQSPRSGISALTKARPEGDSQSLPFCTTKATVYGDTDITGHQPVGTLIVDFTAYRIENEVFIVHKLPSRLYFNISPTN